jgi:hypothetical protein
LRSESRATSATSRNGYARLKRALTVDSKFDLALLWVVQALARTFVRCRGVLSLTASELAVA